MIIRAPRPRENFTVIRNDVLTDNRLGWRARGLLVYLLSKPDNWRTTTANLASQSPDGIHAVRSAMTQLETYGYIRRIKQQDSAGLWSTHTLIYDQPVDNPGEKYLTFPQPGTGFPTSDFLTA